MYMYIYIYIYIYIYTYIHMYVCCYTPLPFNLAKKQQQQALLLSVLAIAPPHRSGLYSTLAILEATWWPCPIQVFSQKLTSGAPGGGGGRQVRRCPPRTAHFVPQKSRFWPKTAPKPTQSGKTRLYTSTSHLVSVCSATAFDTRLPRYVAYTEGSMSSVMPVEIFSFLLSLVPVPERAGHWFVLWTLPVYFGSMMSTRFSKDCNVVCALLGEGTAVPDEFV